MLRVYKGAAGYICQVRNLLRVPVWYSNLLSYLEFCWDPHSLPALTHILSQQSPSPQDSWLLTLILPGIQYSSGAKWHCLVGLDLMHLFIGTCQALKRDAFPTTDLAEIAAGGCLLLDGAAPCTLGLASSACPALPLDVTPICYLLFWTSKTWPLFAFWSVWNLGCKHVFSFLHVLQSKGQAHSLLLSPRKGCSIQWVFAEWIND